MEITIMIAKFPCPVCGKYNFSEIDDYEICDVCGWENSVAQYDDHDYAEAQNALSVNELRLEYQLLINEKTKDKTETFRKIYREERDKVHALYRARRKALEPFSCEDMKGQCIAIRLAYIEKLKLLSKSN